MFDKLKLLNLASVKNYILKYKTILFLFFLFLVCKSLQAQKGVTNFSTQSSSLKFIENKTQWDARVRYKTGGTGHYVFLEKNCFTYLFVDAGGKKMHPHNDFKAGDMVKSHAFNQTFLNSNVDVKLSGSEKYAEHYNYFIGSDSTKWSSNVGLFGAVNYENLYNGIDMKVYSKATTMKYEFTVAPNTDYHQIKIKYNQAGDVKLDRSGNLVIQTSINQIIEQAPICYQVINNKIKTIRSKFILKNEILSFEMGSYDKTFPLVIDPTLIFCTYTGSTDDNWGTSATYDNAGNLYAAGIVVGNGYPTTLGAFQTLYGGGLSAAANWNPYYGDISISKFNATGTGLVYSTFLGGTNNDFPNSLIVTPNNELIVFGRSYSSDYPVTATAYDQTHGGNADMVITKFNSIGSALIGSTYIGGSLSDGVNYSDNENILGSLKRNYGDDARGEVNIDNAGNIYIASCTYSTDFPVSFSAFQSTFGGGLEDGVVFKLNSNLSSLLFSTYIGGSLNDACYSLDINPINSTIYVTGGTESSNFPTTFGTIHSTYQGGTADGFLFHLNATGSALLASTFIGTSQYDQSYFVKLDNSQVPYIMGQTTGGTYPVTGGTYSNTNSGQFISKVNTALSAYLVSTVIGNGSGGPNLSPTAFAVDICDNVYMAGWGGNFLNQGPGLIGSMPLTANAIQTTTDQATQSDFYIAVMNRNMAQLTFGTYYGGTGSLEHVDGGTSRFDKNGFIYGAICAGCITNDSYLQATPGAWSATNQSNNCNLAAYKIAIPFPYLSAVAAAAPDTFGCGPFTVQFTATTAGQHYAWGFGDPGSGINNSSTLSNPIHTFNLPGTYHVMFVVIDSNFCNITDTAYLTVLVTNDTIKTNIIATDSLVCPSQLVQFTAAGQFGQTYQWNFGDFTSSTLQNPSHSYTSVGTYQVMLIASNPLTCNLHDTAYLNIVVSLTMVTDTATSNTNHGCPPLKVNFTGSMVNGTSFLWNYGDASATNSTVLNPSHIYNSTGIYTATFYAFNPAACVPVDSFQIIINVSTANVTAVAHSTSAIGCKPYTATFSNTSTNAERYYWNFGDPPSLLLDTSTFANPSHIYNNTGIYTVTFVAIDTFTCNKFDTIQIPVAVDTVRVNAAFTANPITGCTPLPVQFTNNSYHALVYDWNFGDGSSHTSTTSPNHTYIDTFSYLVTLIASDSTTCNLHDTATIVIDPYYTYVVAKFKVADTAECKRLDLAITNQSTGATQYWWGFGNGDTSNTFEPIYSYVSPGNYRITLVAKNPLYCKSTDTASQMVHIFKEPSASFTATPFLWKPDSVFQFTNNSSNATIYEWYVDGAYVGNSFNYSQSFHKLGYHTICVIARTTDGCNDSICRQVYVDVKPSIGVPNAFSPDGDGVNDFLFVYGLGIETIDFRIYNRWGELVFETTDRNKGWDGTFKGKPQEMEVYVYVVSATFITGTSRSLKGNVTLVR